MKRSILALCVILGSLAILSCSNASGGSEDTVTPETSSNPSSPSTPATTTPTTTTPITSTLSTDARLSSLALSVGILSPEFSPDTFAYTATVDTSFPSISLTGTAANQKATLDANDQKEQTLTDGMNTLTYTVTAEDGSAKQAYTITVTKEKDTTPPVVTQFTLCPEVIDTASAPATVSGTIVVEDPSGIATVDNLEFQGDSPTPKATVVKNKALSTFTKGVYDWSLTMPQGSARGNYWLLYMNFSICDTKGNHDDTISFPKNTNTSFDITGTGGDMSPPTIKDFTILTPTPVNPSAGDVTVSGTVTFEDYSGIQYANNLVYYAGGYTFGTLQKDDARSSDTTVVYNWSITVKKGSDSGTASLASLTVSDKQGNLIKEWNDPRTHFEIVTK